MEKTTWNDLVILSNENWTCEFGERRENGEYKYFPSLRIKGNSDEAYGRGRIVINEGRGNIGTTTKIVQEQTKLFSVSPQMLKLVMDLSQRKISIDLAEGAANEILKIFNIVD